MTLLLRKAPAVPVFAECISPNAFSGKSSSEVAELQLWEGNRRCSLGDLFAVDGESAAEPGEISISIVGDLSRFGRVGAGMIGGEIRIQGNVGMHLGEEMTGGTIIVEGNVGSWAGCAMKGGAIEIDGNVGDYIGGARRGGVEGMKGGSILVLGNAGVGAGCYMKKGLVKVHGDVAQFAGIRMKDGTIVVQGNAGERVGAFMTGGRIVVRGHIPSILPTFAIEDVKNKVKTDEEEIKGSFYVFSGDLAEHGTGKLYIARDENRHLNGYERLL